MPKHPKKLSPPRHSELDSESRTKKNSLLAGFRLGGRNDEGWRRVLNLIPYYGFLALLIYMPFHIFLAQWLSTITGGLEVWKIGKDVALALFALFTICLVFVQRKGNRVFWGLVAFTAVYISLHVLLWIVHSDIYDRSAILGTVYNSRLPAFLVLGYGTSLLAPTKFVFSSLLKIVLVISTTVALLGVVQYFLPPDFLTHFGYSFERGARPSFLIDDHAGLPRIMSTLREPNALGAYLIVPIVALVSLLQRVRDAARRYILAGSLGLHTLALFMTHSRSAWIAAVVAVGLVVWWRYFAVVRRITTQFWPLILVGVLAIVVVAWTQRNSSFVQEYLLHNNPQEQVEDLDSNDLHWLLVKQGAEGVVDQPLGHGPGTAGLVSIQNPGGGLLTENYYVQIAYEVGIVGLAMFIALNVWLYLWLWRRGDMFGRILCAAFWGYVCTNMLLHTWSNEAVAAQWWLLAGAALNLSVLKTTDKA